MSEQIPERMRGWTEGQTDRQTDGQTDRKPQDSSSYFALIFVSPSLHMWKQRRENLATHPWDLGEDCARNAWGSHRRPGTYWLSSPYYCPGWWQIMPLSTAQIYVVRMLHESKTPNVGPSDEAECGFAQAMDNVGKRRHMCL